MTVAGADAALAGFTDVDAAVDVEPLVSALDEQSALPAIMRLRAAAIALLALRNGDRAVDVGCGLGDVARQLAASVGPTGAVAGIDASETMLAEARRRTPPSLRSLEFRAGNATSLDLPDESFDGAYSERVLQHLDAPGTAVAELVRVTRAGGRVVLVDTDWGMQAIHGADPDLTARIAASWTEHTSHGWSGRQLRSWLIDAGVPDPVVVTDTLVTTDPWRASQPPLTTMAAVAQQAGAVRADEADAWTAQLAQAATRGHFLWAVTLFAVGGTRPRPRR